MMRFASAILAASILAPVLAAPYALLQQRETLAEQPVLNITYLSPVNA